MKKVLSMIIAFTLCVTPVGCGKQAQSAGAQSQTVESQLLTVEAQPVKKQESYDKARISYLGQKAPIHRKPAISFLIYREALTFGDMKEDADR